MTKLTELYKKATSEASDAFNCIFDKYQIGTREKIAYLSSLLTCALIESQTHALIVESLLNKIQIEVDSFFVNQKDEMQYDVD